MSSRDFIPRKEDELLKWTVNFIGYLAPRTTQFNFPQEECNSIQTQFSDFEEKLRIAEEPATRTKLTVQDKNTARKLLEKTVRTAIKEFLTYNRLVNDTDRDGLGIPIHKTTRTSAPVAHEAPDVDVDTSVLAHVSIHFFEKGHKHKKAKPAGQHAVEIAWIIRDTLPTRWDELLHSVVDTSTPHTFSFENDQRGMRFYFALRWENTRGEKGPWSAIQSAIIP
jgi:hypothetical protein